MSRHASPPGGFLFHALGLFELARVLVRPDHVASFIVNADDSVMRSTAMPRVIDCRARVLMPQRMVVRR
jgi:hypothetical protein